MSVENTRKIKANYIEYDGEYVHIISRSMRRSRAFFIAVLFIIFSMILEELLSLIAFDNIKDIMALYMLCALAVACLTLSSAGDSVYTIPMRDIAVIKEYPDRDSVTVIFDEDRTKSRRFIASSDH